jgi:hypothetical protein
MKDALGHGSNAHGAGIAQVGKRYQVIVKPYSLAAGQVGKHIGQEKVISSHNSLKAASGKAGSMITGKMQGVAQEHAGSGNGYFLGVRDTHTGAELSADDARHFDKKIAEHEGAMGRLRDTFHVGQNRYGEYGNNTRAAFDRHAKEHARLTGLPARNIYDR